MNLDSPLFDRVRSKPRCEAGSQAQAAATPGGCAHPGCTAPGDYRAPMGRGREGEYHRFCLDHVRAYNASYNYFKGMTDDDVMAYQKDALTGHRPTWRMNGAAAEAPATEPGTADPFGLFGRREPRREAPRPEPEAPHMTGAARKAYETLGVDAGTDAPAVKAAYKAIVKRLHPDANGGDRSREDKLRACIDAYNYLRSAGLA